MTTQRPSDATIARLLREGASGIGSSHAEYCISSDGCSCYSDIDEMLSAANILDPAPDAEKQRSEDEAIVASVRGFPIFENREAGERYFAALNRLAGEDPEASTK